LGVQVIRRSHGLVGAEKRFGAKTEAPEMIGQKRKAPQTIKGQRRSHSKPGAPYCHYIRGQQGVFGLKKLKIVSGALPGPAVGYDLVLELLAFSERTQTCALNSGDVHEHIGAACLRLNEDEAFFGVEPLDCTSCHYGVP
jgi:hypothetical protein